MTFGKDSFTISPKRAQIHILGGENKPPSFVLTDFSLKRLHVCTRVFHLCTFAVVTHGILLDMGRVLALNAFKIQVYFNKKSVFAHHVHTLFQWHNMEVLVA